MCLDERNSKEFILENGHENWNTMNEKNHEINKSWNKKIY